MGKFDGILLCSDVDGTLLPGNHIIPSNNLAALEYFTAAGGQFLLATGRGIAPGTQKIVNMLPINAPCVLLNGGQLHDFSKNIDVKRIPLPEEAKQLAATVRRERPELRMSLWVPTNWYEIGGRVLEGYEHCARDMATVTETWCKLIVETSAEEQPSFLRWLAEQGGEGMQYVSSSPYFSEVMPLGPSKGNGVAAVADYLSIPRDRVYTIGDYDNDWEMLTLSGVHPFCPANAPAHIQAVCEATLCPVEDGALAALISVIEERITGEAPSFV